MLKGRIVEVCSTDEVHRRAKKGEKMLSARSHSSMWVLRVAYPAVHRRERGHYMHLQWNCANALEIHNNNENNDVQIAQR